MKTTVAETTTLLVTERYTVTTLPPEISVMIAAEMAADDGTLVAKLTELGRDHGLPNVTARDARADWGI